MTTGAAPATGRQAWEQIRVEAALSVSAAQHGLAVRCAHMGTWEYRLATGTILCSQRCCEVLGMPEKTDLSFVAALIHPEDRAELEASVSRALSGAEGAALRRAFRIRHADAERWVALHGGAFFDGAGTEGRPAGLAGVIQDITAQIAESPASERPHPGAPGGKTAELENRNRELTSEIAVRRQVEDEMRKYARRLIALEEELRKKLAAELHDELGRDLTALGLNLTIASNALADGSLDELRMRLADSQNLVSEVSRTVRGIMSNLRPPVLDDYGLVAALRWFARGFSQRTGLDVAVEARDDLPRLSDDKELALFRVAQEALLNSAKHAGAHKVTVGLSSDRGSFSMVLKDDGRGFPVGEERRRTQSSGWGLAIMRERIDLVGGTLWLDAAPGAGTEVAVEVPEDEV